MSAHAGKIKASVGLTDSVYDRNTWSQFLVGALVFTFCYQALIAQESFFHADSVITAMVACRHCPKIFTTA